MFDGHGGPEVADFVQKSFVEELKSNEHFQKKQYDLALTETFMNFDKILGTPEGKKKLDSIQKENQAKGNAEEKGREEASEAGCTAVACIITDSEIVVANAGDSRCFLGINKKAHDMSHDHKPDLTEEKTRITTAGGQVAGGRVNGNLNLSRALGDLEYKNNKNLPQDQQLIISKPDIQKHSLKGVQHIILGCDGLF